MLNFFSCIISKSGTSFFKSFRSNFPSLREMISSQKNLNCFYEKDDDVKGISIEQWTFCMISILDYVELWGETLMSHFIVYINDCTATYLEPLVITYIYNRSVFIDTLTFHKIGYVLQHQQRHGEEYRSNSNFSSTFPTW